MKNSRFQYVLHIFSRLLFSFFTHYFAILSYFLHIFIFFNVPIPNKTTRNTTGNIQAHNIPGFKLSFTTPATLPTSAGPAEHPRSPARAIIANMAVPPFFIAAEALLNVPGHIIPTENPQIAQADRLINGDGKSHRTCQMDPITPVT
ncbi:MAG: hypothetical protein SOZ48_03240 [Eubacterium sp.]|nr:hypothetical protein [Eubacterium sp.]